MRKKLLSANEYPVPVPTVCGVISDLRVNGGGVGGGGGWGGGWGGGEINSFNSRVPYLLFEVLSLTLKLMGRLWAGGWGAALPFLPHFSVRVYWNGKTLLFSEQLLFFQSRPHV